MTKVYFILITTVLILWGTLLPGYILSLDLIYAPAFSSFYTVGYYVNNLPLFYLIKLLNLFLEGWVIEKILLFCLFIFLITLAIYSLSSPKYIYAKYFFTLIYIANLFIYERMLAGQLNVLFGYSLLPLITCFVFSFTDKPTYRNGLILAAALALVGIFSLQLLIMSTLISVTWIIFSLKKLNGSMNSILVVCGTFLTFISYWLVPALFRVQTIESTFTSEHWSAFAATGQNHVPVLLNLLVLGGFWGEGSEWMQHFLWPQQYFPFWIAFVSLLLLMVVGFRSMMKTEKKKAFFFLTIGIVAYILATGAAYTPFQGFNIFLYSRIPFWSGFRDSQKFIAVLALSYAVFAGYGFESVVNAVRSRWPHLVRFAIPTLFLIPIFLGMFVWFGFANQLQPVWYPAEWSRAKEELAANPSSKALILPWQGYFSLSFDRNLIVANPASQFFGPQAVVSQNVRLDQVYDQSTDPTYLAIDRAVRHNSPENGQTMAAYLKGQRIQYVIYFQDIKATDTFTYDFLQSPDFTLEWSTPELQFYRIN